MQSIPSRNPCVSTHLLGPFSVALFAKPRCCQGAVGELAARSRARRRLAAQVHRARLRPP